MGNSDVTMLWVLNGATALLFFALTFAVNRITKKLDDLTKKDENLHEIIEKRSAEISDLVNTHREDLLRNYVRQEHLEPLKKDIIGRVDRLEAAFNRHSEDQAAEPLRL